MTLKDYSPRKPFAESCERNKTPILNVLKQYLVQAQTVLEVGSGTGQHAIHFAEQLPFLTWLTSDLEINHHAIRAWQNDAGLANVQGPHVLDLANPLWPVSEVETVFTANTLHIVSWRLVEAFFHGAAKALKAEGLLFVYGPFNYNGTFTSESNARFNQWLLDRDPQSGIREFEMVDLLAQRQGLTLLDDIAMPANNRMLVWQRNADDR